MSHNLKLVLALITGVLLGIVVIRPFVRNHSDPPDRKQGKPAAKAPSGVSTVNSETIVRLDPTTEARLGIRTTPLEGVRKRNQATLPAKVLPVQNLAAMVSAYKQVSAKLRKAEISAEVSEHEFDRLQKLYRNQQNISKKALQSAQGNYHDDEVDVQAARENIALAVANIRQNWGSAIANWVTSDANAVNRVLRRQDVLVEMTQPLGEHFTAPHEVTFDLPAGGRAGARLISAFPQVDPRVQGVGFLYVTEARPGLAPGLNLVANFGVGLPRKGVIVPASAVVWWHGLAWVYVATSPGHFTRREVPTDVSVHDGWFATRGYSPGELVVTSGAEQLLAVEFRPAPSSLGSEEGDED